MEKAAMDKSLSVITTPTPQEESIDFVITSSSPGSTFAHLRRTSVSGGSNNTAATASSTPARRLDTSMGSAKKVGGLIDFDSSGSEFRLHVNCRVSEVAEAGYGRSGLESVCSTDDGESYKQPIIVP